MGEFVPDSLTNDHTDLLASIAALPRGAVVLLLGDVDTGKSTLAGRLVDSVDRAVLLDTDVGQGTLAPPTAIGATLVEGGKTSTIGQWFVGAVSPVRHMRQLCDGAVCLLALARRRNPNLVVVDTCGLVRGRIGVALKTRLIRAMRPDLIVAVALSTELDPILQSIPARSQNAFEKVSAKTTSPPAPLLQKGEFLSTVLRATPSVDVRRKTASYRRRVRAERLAAALEGSRLVTFEISNPDLLAPLAARPRDFAGLLAGLIDAHGLCLGIARVEAVDASSIMLSSAVKQPDRIAAVQFGELILAPNGTTLADARAIPVQIPVTLAQPHRGKSR